MADLLLFALAGRLHAVCGNEILRTEEIAGVFHLPLHPPQMAGLTLIDDSTITLADLAACLGYPCQPRNSDGTALLLSEEDGIAFFVADFVYRQATAPQSLLPVPDSLISPVISRCTLIEGELIPLIDLTALRTRLEEGHWTPPESTLKLAPHVSRHLESCNKFRLLHLGGEAFALPEDDLRVPTEAVIKFCPLGKSPPFLGGLASTDDGLRPVIHLESLLGLPPAPSSQVPLFGQAAGKKVIFFADLLQEKTRASLEPMALPPLAQRRGMRHALMAEGKVIPLLDLPELLEDGHILPHWSERYSTGDAGAGDSEMFFQEFSLLGAHFAIPKVEVEAVLPLLPMRSIPTDLPLLRGIAEYQGALWPVLDLTPYFGHHIPPDRCGGLLAVQNNDFRALVMTEEVFDEVCPDQKDRRKLPLALPQHLVYDCYLQAKEVILVLNVKAMALNFDPAQAKICRESIKVEGQAKDAAIEPSLAGIAEEEKGTAPDPRAPEVEGTDALAPRSLAEEFYAAEPVPAAIVPAIEEEVPPLETHSAACREPESADSTQEELIPAEPPLQINQEPTTNLSEPPKADAIKEEPTDFSVYGALLRGDESLELPTVEMAESPPAPCDSASHEQETATTEREGLSPGTPSATDTAAETSFQPGAFSLLRSDEEPPSVLSEEGTLSQGSEQEVFPAPVPQQAVSPPTDASPRGVPDEDGFRLTAPAEPVNDAEIQPHLNNRRQPSRRLSRAAMLATLLAALTAGAGSTLYFAGKLPQEDRPRSIAVEMIEAAALIPEAAPLAPFRGEARRPGPPSSTAPAPDPVFTPEAPAAPAEVPPTTYRVVPGDTLWDIAYRRTGDPFFYRRIASENAIPDPNLIHPGQEIFLPSE